MLSKQILGCLFGAMFTMTSLPTHLLAGGHCHEYDYVIVGNGTSGAVLARKLSDNKKHSVLVIEAGPNLSDDPQVLNPIIFANIYDLTFSPKFSEPYPIPLPLFSGNYYAGLLQAVTYTEGKMWGGGSAHNYLFAVHSTPEIYDSWAEASGNSRWEFNNIRQTIRAIETYTPNGTIANPVERGSSGPIFVTQAPPVDTSNLANAMSTVTNAPLVADYNDPTEGNTGVSSYQEFITPGPNSTRSFSISGYLPDSVITPEGKGRHGRKLKVLSNTSASRILFKGKKAVGIECVVSGAVEKVKRVYAKKKVILCAGGIQTPALLQRSGIGDATLLSSLDIPVVVNNPNVGANLVDHYGAVVALSGNEPLAIQAMINGYPYFPNDDVRRVQYLTNPGAGFIIGYGFIMDPQSRGSVQIVTKNPFTNPLVSLNMFSDGPVNTPGTDAYTLVSFLKIAKDIADEAGVSVIRPTAADYTNDDSLLAYCQSNPNLILTSHITGTSRMSTTAADGVVDGNLHVFGVKDLMIADLGVAPTAPNGNTCYPVYVIANEAARILGAS